MDRHNVHMRRDFRELPPELPNIGIGNGLLHCRADPVDRGDELADGQVAAQQHLVADDHALHGARIAAGDFDPARNLGLVLGPVRAEPRPSHSFSP